MDAQPKTKLVEIEEKVLKFWDKDDTFKKSLEKPSPKGEFVFYDGPPFATGLPHYGHIVAGTIKDAIPRYKTMQGYHVRRRWGWDCHGLPVENLVEKELGLKSKKDIEIFGIEKFNAVARASVLRYVDDWKRMMPRFGRWVDMENDYRTMDSSYTESVWWAFKDLYNKGLMYEGYKSMQICPHCGTTLSNMEVGLGYKDISDISVYAKFELVDETKTYLIAWTTTPWTLPGNVALAVGADIEYVEVEFEGLKYVLAKQLVSKVFENKNFTMTKELKGSELVGKEYKPIFDYYSSDKNLKNREKGWKVCAADFVKTDEGTGIVHIAPAFGDEDMKLGQKENLPFIQHVAMDGKFKPEVKDFTGMDVKPKSDDEKVRLGTDIAIIKYLQEHGSYFDKKKITHSYPHCWRCETPLLNYAASSWFVKVVDIKNKLVSENKKVNWVPPEIGSERFGKWLENAHDWAISRSRFWGAPIPVWKCDECKSLKVVSSLDDIRQNTKPRNKYILMRHGEAENNTRDILDGVNLNTCHLTQKGIGQVRTTAEQLRGKRIDLIVSSPFARTRETADIVASVIGLPKDKIRIEDRLRELNTGIFDGRPISEFHAYEAIHDAFDHPFERGESYSQVASRMLSAVIDIDKQNEGKTILLLTHHAPAWLLVGNSLALSRKDIEKLWKDEGFLNNADFIDFEYKSLPRNKNNEIDFHRPYIDHIELECSCGGKMKRVPEVFDCWFEAGSMPYAEAHYPQDKNEFNPRRFLPSKGFPADFIAEGLDQTRGWFYSMLVLGVGLFKKSPYKNVIVNGIVLAEDGQKMSKSKQNYPDPMDVINKYGMDAVRYYLLASPLMHAEDIRFSEKGVDEISKKLLQRLDNVLVFYETYTEKKQTTDDKQPTTKNVLDQWIVARLNQTIVDVTEGLETYVLDKASRPIMDFVDDLSNWYLRRSRDRFKSDDIGDKNAALDTTRYVLCTLSKIMAPFMPFYAEHLYYNTTRDKESVHVQAWPSNDLRGKSQETRLIEDMKEVRKIVTLGLEVRAKANIKVRQPLANAKIKMRKAKLSEELLSLVKDELNVKSVIYGDTANEIELDINLTKELKEEGVYREFLRAVQELRKKENLSVKDRAVLVLESDEKFKELIHKNLKELKRVAGITEIKYEHLAHAEEISVDEYTFKIGLQK